ncbi:hypothetical protein [Alteribacter aurantiacus]|uniref:hypothetical protein n=1 Tax=Alteribacter aurantiacus TaxID=254410 RepID=UPI000406BCC7|nr:hypothetical protein [Alteribacter aurantiacus]
MEGLFKRSIAEQTPIEIIYMSKTGIVTKRVVSVRQINDEAIIGFCHMRKALRTFKRMNILSALPVKHKFRKQDDQLG